MYYYRDRYVRLPEIFKYVMLTLKGLGINASFKNLALSCFFQAIEEWPVVVFLLEIDLLIYH